MTREAFIRKWLANKDFQYCEEGRAQMREDLDKVIDYAQQKLDIASVSGKRPSRKLFCKVWTQVFGEEIDNVNQLVYGKAALGEELYELCLKFHKAACATAKGEERKE